MNHDYAINANYNIGIIDGNNTLKLNGKDVTKVLKGYTGSDSINITNENVISVKDKGITTGKIADAAVTAGKIADNAVTTNKLADGVVTSDKLADGAVTADKLADNAVSGNKIADGSIPNIKLSTNIGAGPSYIILSRYGVTNFVPTSPDVTDMFCSRFMVRLYNNKDMEMLHTAKAVGPGPIPANTEYCIRLNTNKYYFFANDLNNKTAASYNYYYPHIQMSRCVYPIYYNDENYSSDSVGNFNFNITKVELVDVLDSYTGDIVKCVDTIYGKFDKQIPVNSIITLHAFGSGIIRGY